jgi:hypothetical protein
LQRLKRIFNDVWIDAVLGELDFELVGHHFDPVYPPRGTLRGEAGGVGIDVATQRDHASALVTPIMVASNDGSVFSWRTTTYGHRREHARVQLRPEGVVFALPDAASFLVGTLGRTRDPTMMIERGRSDLHN